MNLINQNVIEQLLFDTYAIDMGLKIRKDFKECASEEERKKLFHHYLLNNLFLIRRNNDPGFYAYTLEQVKVNKEIQEKVKKYIYHLFSLNIEMEDDLFSLSPHEKETKSLFDSVIKSPTTFPSSPLSIIIENLKKVSKNSFEYFEKRREIAIENGNEDEVLVLSQLLSEYKDDVFCGFQLFSDENVYNYQINSHRWLYSQNQYILENIKFASLYTGRPPFIFSDFFRLLRDLVVPDSSFSISLLNITESMGNPEEKSILEKLLRYNKFINNSFSIASIMWFNTHGESEKIEILNQEYLLKLTEENLQNCEKFFGDCGLSKSAENDYYFFDKLANELFHSSFFDEAITIWNYILKRSTNMELLYSCFDNVATAFREKSDYEKALEYYEKSLELSEKLSVSSSYRKKVCIELKNVGEMHYNLGEIGRTEKYFFMAEKKASNLSNMEKASVLFNLSCAYRRTQNYDKEFEYLLKVLELEGLSSEIEEIVLNRLKILNSFEFMLVNGKFDCKKLERLDLQNKADRLSKIGSLLFRSFQFQKSMPYFEKEYEIEKSEGFNCFNSLNYMATNSLYSGDAFKAKKLCEQLVEADIRLSYKSISQINVGLLEIKEGSFDSGIEYLEKAMDIFKRHPEDIVEFLIVLIKSSTIFWSKDNVHKIIDSLKPKINSLKYNFYLVVANAYKDIGFAEDALHYYDCGLSTNSDSEVKSLLLYNKGLALSSLGESESAIEMFKMSIDCLNSSYAWENLAFEHRNKLDILKSIESIDNALNVASESERDRLLIAKEELEILSKKVLPFSCISDEEDNVKKPLYSAERLVLRDIKKMDDADLRDFSTALHYYGKALENMLDRHISERIRKSIYQEFGDCVVADYGRFKDKDFPLYIKNMLDKNRNNSIGLGQWKTIINYSNEKSKNPVYQKFKDELLNLYSSEELNKIKFACGMIKDYRNSSAHGEVKSYDDVIKVREKIIQHLNDVIYVLY